MPNFDSLRVLSDALLSSVPSRPVFLLLPHPSDLSWPTDYSGSRVTILFGSPVVRTDIAGT